MLDHAAKQDTLKGQMTVCLIVLLHVHQSKNLKKKIRRFGLISFGGSVSG